MTTIEPHRLLKFDLIARCAILAQASATSLLAWFVPTSLTAKLITQGGVYGNLVLILFTGIVLVGLLDIFINDILPPQVYLEAVRKRRHSIFHILAGLYFVQAFVGVGQTLNFEDFLSLVYLISGIVAAWYSWAISLRANHV